jgi:hypothetical protein
MLAQPLIHPRRSADERSAPPPAELHCPGTSPEQRAFHFATRSVAPHAVSAAVAPVCPRCKSPVTGDAVRPGPGLGTFCRPCFDAWDRESEALELEFGGAVVPDPEIELEADPAAGRAA